MKKIEDQFEENWDEEELGPSKSQVKRDMLALQDLARDLATMTKTQRSKVTLDDELAAAIDVAVKIKDKGAAFIRQIQYTGKLLRSRDSQAIQREIDLMRNKHNEQNKLMVVIERERERLLTQDEYLQKFIDKHPQVDIQQLRQLIRQAKKETGEQAGKATKALFQLLKGLM